jgi:hypothetical protein
MMSKPICRNCIWFDPELDGGACLHEKAVQINVVTGAEFRHTPMQMRVYRHLCDMEGKLYEAFPDTTKCVPLASEPF